jgi:hypothetical protein
LRLMPSCAAAMPSQAQELDHETRTISTTATMADAQSRIDAFAGRGYGLEYHGGHAAGPVRRRPLSALPAVRKVLEPTLRRSSPEPCVVVDRCAW